MGLSEAPNIRVFAGIKFLCAVALRCRICWITFSDSGRVLAVSGCWEDGYAESGAVEGGNYAANVAGDRIMRVSIERVRRHPRPIESKEVIQ